MNNNISMDEGEFCQQCLSNELLSGCALCGWCTIDKARLIQKDLPGVQLSDTVLTWHTQGLRFNPESHQKKKKNTKKSRIEKGILFYPQTILSLFT